MNFTNTPPDWAAEGIEPTSELKTNGFIEGYKPPAKYFDWFWTKVSKCLKELQDKSTGQTQYDGTTAKGEIFNDYTNNVASGIYSHAENSHTTAQGSYSHSSGYQTVANDTQFVAGRYNTEATAPTSTTDTTGSLFIIGCGTETATANALRITADGKCYGSQSFGASGADFAEMFEWLDGNTNNEDRRGLFVTLDGDKIRLANSDDDYILGVVSAIPTVIGDTASEEWHGKYKTDVFGNRLTETINIEETTDEVTGEIIPAHTETRFVLSDDYNSDEEYKSREKRKEWASIGLIGKMVVIDDGTCQANGYCKAGNNGVATEATTGYRVLKRIDDNHIRILYR